MILTYSDEQASFNTLGARADAEISTLKAAVVNGEAAATALRSSLSDASTRASAAEAALLAAQTKATQDAATISARDATITDLRAQLAAAQAAGPSADEITYEALKARAVAAGISAPNLQQVFDQLGPTEYKIVRLGFGVIDTQVAWGKAPLVAGASVAAEYAFRPPKSCRGIVGPSAPGRLGQKATTAKAVIRLTPNTCKSQSEGGSWFQAGGSGSGDFLLKNVHVEGTDQGLQTAAKASTPGYDGVSPKLFTNVFLNAFGGQVTVEDVLVTGWYGNNGAPPGETFGLEVYNCDNHVLRRVEADGRREVGGLSFGAVGITSGSCIGAKWYNCWSHHQNGKTAAAVFYQVFDSKTYDCVMGDEADGDGTGQFNGVNGGGFNQERAGNCEHYRMKFYINRKVGDKGTHFNHSGDQWDLKRNNVLIRSWNPSVDEKMLIVDAVFNNIWSAATNLLYVATWIPYGSSPNVIDDAPQVVHTDANGALVADPFKWIWGGQHITVTYPYHATA